MGKNQHIIHKQNSGWIVKGEGNVRPTKILATKQEAIDYGRIIAKNQCSELIIHGRNGKIQDKNSYGNDNCPPRDRVH